MGTIREVLARHDSDASQRAERSYRRGVHHGVEAAIQVLTAAHALGRRPYELLATLSNKAGDMRNSSEAFALYIDELVSRVNAACPTCAAADVTPARRGQDRGEGGAT